MNQPQITPEIIEQHGFTPEEYERVKEILGREPNYTELGVFSVMWSEHCSYKSSRDSSEPFADSNGRARDCAARRKRRSRGHRRRLVRRV